MRHLRQTEQASVCNQKSWPEEVQRQPTAFYGIPGEAALVSKICRILQSEPMEVNNLSSKVAAIFNEVVRSSDITPFSADKRNDGSFKRWLLACGFEVGPLFERNRALVYLPAFSYSLLKEAKEGIRCPRPYRGKHWKHSLSEATSGTVQSSLANQVPPRAARGCYDYSSCGRRWQVRQHRPCQKSHHIQANDDIHTKLDGSTREVPPDPVGNEITSKRSLQPCVSDRHDESPLSEQRVLSDIENINANAFSEPLANESMASDTASDISSAPVHNVGGDAVLWVEVGSDMLHENDAESEDEQEDFVLVGRDEEIAAKAGCHQVGASNDEGHLISSVSEDELIDGRWCLEGDAWLTSRLGGQGC